MDERAAAPNQTDSTSPSEKCGRRDGATSVVTATGRGAPTRPPAGNLRLAHQHFAFAALTRGAHRAECACGYEGPARPTWRDAECDIARHLASKSVLVDAGRYGVLRVRADGSYAFLGAV